MMRSLLVMRMLMAGVLTLSGCVSREVVYLGDSTTKTVRLRETKRHVKVWVKDSTGTDISAEADLLEGGYYRKDLR